MQLERTEEELRKKKNALHETEENSAATQKELGERVGKLATDLQGVSAQKENNEREFQAKIRSLESELEKVSTLNNTLQEVIESRESDDRRNVVLMQMLNAQLDDNKQRAQASLEEEHRKVLALRKDLEIAQTRLQQLSEECDLRAKERDQIKKQSDSDLQDYRTKLEQLKFDMKYLHSELHTYKTDLAKQQQTVATVKSEAAEETQSAKLALETQNKKVEELEGLLRRKDREHFDKVTFLNAQISNNRTIISQLQQKLNKEREEKAQELAGIQQELEQKNQSIRSATANLEEKKSAASETEMKLNADVTILKTTVFQLQSALVEKEKELETTVAAKDEETRRLRRKLDEHFIPHRNEIESTEAAADGKAAEKSMEAVLNERVNKLTRELDVRNRVSLEVETRLKAQISNLNHIIDSLQAELQKTKEEALERDKIHGAEEQRLRTLLEQNFIEYKK